MALGYTTAGRHLFGRQALTQEMRDCAAPSNSPVSFTTGGGAQQSADSLAFAGSELLEGEEVYILKECPPAQSIGKTVMDKGYMFIWDPREQVPYLIPPSIIPKCRLRIPRKHRICASIGLLSMFHSTTKRSGLFGSFHQNVSSHLVPSTRRPQRRHQILFRTKSTHHPSQQTT